MIKVIIAGGRDFIPLPIHYVLINNILCNYKYKDIELVSGCASGADQIPFEIRDNTGVRVKPFPAPWDDIEGKPEHEIGTTKQGKKYWKFAGHHRNQQMADYSSALILFWNGRSTGSKDMLEKSVKGGLDIRVVRYG